MIEILAIGAGATVQDLGRAGYAALGVPRSGAFDPRAAALANRLVGNAAEAATIEVVLGGLAVRLRRAATLALTGAPCALSGPSSPLWGAAMTLPAGAELVLGAPAHGLRSWLAVRGGFDVPAVLGSRSTDTLGGLGPAPLAVGDLVPIGTRAAGEISGAEAWHWSYEQSPRIAVQPGPRRDWVRADSVRLLWDSTWTVRPDSNRVGIRLDGPSLHWSGQDELPSEAVLPGAIQIPPDGRPIVFGPDAPTTGGYPVVGIVPASGLAVLAQLRPGDALRFIPAP